MICINTNIPKELNDIDDELKAIIILKILYVFISLKIEIKEMNL